MNLAEVVDFSGEYLSITGPNGQLLWDKLPETSASPRQKISVEHIGSATTPPLVVFEQCDAERPDATLAEIQEAVTADYPRRVEEYAFNQMFRGSVQDPWQP